MTHRCKTCGVTDESQFTKSSRTVCRNCAAQKRKIALQTKLVNSDTPVTSSASLASKMPKMLKTDSTLKNIIASQQKMLEHQQRQTDALFNLAEKLLEKINTPVITAQGSSESIGSATLTPRRRSPISSSRLISHTPRVRKNLVHYKDRLNNDL